MVGNAGTVSCDRTSHLWSIMKKKKKIPTTTIFFTKFVMKIIPKIRLSQYSFTISSDYLFLGASLFTSTIIFQYIRLQLPSKNSFPLSLRGKNVASQISNSKNRHRIFPEPISPSFRKKKKPSIKYRKKKK